jgi:long-subunit acyl-CoA synthetase (AMP-forming)
MMTDIACWKINVTSVPLYDTLGEDTIKWLFEQTEVQSLFIASAGIEKIETTEKLNQVKL